MSAIGRCYLVCSAVYGEVVPVLDYGSGPIEYGRDVTFAYARNARRAKVLALRWFRRRGAHFLGDAECPFRGMIAERYPAAQPGTEGA